MKIESKFQLYVGPVIVDECAKRLKDSLFFDVRSGTCHIHAKIIWETDEYHSLREIIEQALGFKTGIRDIEVFSQTSAKNV